MIDGDGYAATPQGYIQFQPINGTSFSFERCPLSAICCKCKQRCDISLHFWVNVCMCAASGAPSNEQFMQQIIIILVFWRKPILRGEKNNERKTQRQSQQSQRHANAFKWRGCNRCLIRWQNHKWNRCECVNVYRKQLYRLLPTKNEYYMIYPAHVRNRNAFTACVPFRVSTAPNHFSAFAFNTNALQLDRFASRHFNYWNLANGNEGVVLVPGTNTWHKSTKNSLHVFAVDAPLIKYSKWKRSQMKPAAKFPSIPRNICAHSNNSPK